MARKDNNHDHNGVKNPAARLTVADVIAIRADPRNHTEVAADYDVTPSNICSIRKRKSWANVA